MLEKINKKFVIIGIFVVLLLGGFITYYAFYDKYTSTEDTYVGWGFPDGETKSLKVDLINNMNSCYAACSYTCDGSDSELFGISKAVGMVRTRVGIKSGYTGSDNCDPYSKIGQATLKLYCVINGQDFLVASDTVTTNGWNKDGVSSKEYKYSDYNVNTEIPDGCFVLRLDLQTSRDFGIYVYSIAEATLVPATYSQKTETKSIKGSTSIGC